MSPDGYKIPAIHTAKGCRLVFKTETVEVNKERLFNLLMRLSSESLPLFSSSRLEGLHKDVKLLLDELVYYDKYAQD